MTSKSKSQTITLSADAIPETLAAIKTIDEKVSSLVGTAAQMRTKALEAVGVVTLPLEAEYRETLAEVVGLDDITTETVDTLAFAVEGLRQQVKQATDEAVTEWLKQNATDGAPAIEALLKDRQEKVNHVTALGQLFGQTVDIPKAPRSSGGSSGGHRSAKVSGASYWRQYDGKDKEFQSEKQNSVSSLAFYYSEKLTGTKMGADAFVEWAKSNHSVDVKQATPWTITANGLTLGMDVISAETPAN